MLAYRFGGWLMFGALSTTAPFAISRHTLSCSCQIVQPSSLVTLYRTPVRSCSTLRTTRGSGFVSSSIHTAIWPPWR